MYKALNFMYSTNALSGGKHYNHINIFSQFMIKFCGCVFPSTPIHTINIVFFSMLSIVVDVVVVGQHLWNRNFMVNAFYIWILTI